MSYAAELDDFRQVVRQGYASNTLTHWPKVEGVGNVEVTSATYTLHRPYAQDTEVLASGSCTVTDVDGVSKLTLTVDASAITTWLLDEYYRATLLITYAGEVLKRDVYFDVGRSTYRPQVSLNDLLEEDANLDRVLTRQADVISDGRTAEAHASVLGVKAWGDVREWLRSKLAESGRILPRAILDHESVHRVVVAATVARAYRAQGGSPDSESGLRADWWGDEARNRLSSMGPLAYDDNQDGTADATVSSFGIVCAGRSWH